MSVRRFLNRRDKSPSHQEKAQQPGTTIQHNPKQPEHFAGVCTDHHASPDRHGHHSKKADKEHEKKVKALLERLWHYGVDSITEQNVEYALHRTTPQDDPEAAFRILCLLEDTYSGIVKPYDPGKKLRGAVNKEGVSCYLDALLFSMFLRLENFEAMLYDNYADPKQKRLGALLRLWVNMLRSGQLITTDVTGHIQRALEDCGWTDAGGHEQQDPSEAFTFITGQLELPMLTLKMDMFHTGKEDPADDHKFVNERLLEVAILDAPAEGRNVITLEDCLEHYFNNRIEVKRHLENQRRNTLKSDQPLAFFSGSVKNEKEPGTHVEGAELPGTPNAADSVVATPVAETPKPNVTGLRPTSGRKRQDSIFSQRRVVLDGIDPETLSKTDSATPQHEAPGRKLSTRTEVLMPAWQFFKLLPWYTDNMPTSDAQVATHFARQRPILGICLKRYSCTLDGQARKREDFVDIPLEIAVPNFVSDDEMEANGEQVGGNFRLMLQAVVCHRGVSVHSGHYVSLCRNQSTGLASRRGSLDSSEEPDDDPWLRFDDMARERVAEVNIHEALKRESPYLLFYQVQPIGEDGHSIHELPSYTEATSRAQSDANPMEKPYLNGPLPSDPVLPESASDPLPLDPRAPPTDAADWQLPPSERTSTDASSTLDFQRGRPPAAPSTTDPTDPAARQTAITIDTSSTTDTDRNSIKTDPTSASVPSTPSDEKPGGANAAFLSLGKAFGAGSRRGSNKNKDKPDNAADSGKSVKGARSRASSTDAGANSNRITFGMGKLTQRRSKVPALPSGDSVPEIVPSEAVAKELEGQKPVAKPEGTSVGEADAVEGNAGGSVRVPVSQPPLVGAKSKKERKRLKGSGKGDGQEERECALM